MCLKNRRAVVESEKSFSSDLCFNILKPPNIFLPNMLICNVTFLLWHQEGESILPLSDPLTNRKRCKSLCNFEGLVLRYLQFPPSGFAKCHLEPRLHAVRKPKHQWGETRWKSEDLS